MKSMVAKSLKKIPLVILCGIGTIGFSVSSSSAQQSLPSASEAEMNSLLIDSARELNQLLPAMMDHGMRLDEVIAGNRELNYYSTLISYSTAILTTREPELNFFMRSHLLQSLCQNEITYRIMSQYDVSFRYHIYGNDARHFLSIPISESDC